MTYLTLAKMADAAFAQDIQPGFEIAAGYYGGPGAFHVWPASDWGRFPGYRLPIWVPSQGNKDGAADGEQAWKALSDLGVPFGSYIVLDMETMRDRTYVTRFGMALNPGQGYRTWVYGSRSTVFGNPPLNGYWVADYGISTQQGRALLETAHVRAWQYAANLAPGYDASLVKEWTEGGMWHG